MKTHEYYMNEALKEAQKAYDIGEVPIGAVVVCNDTIIGRGYNLRETSQNATTHAEMIAIQQANKQLGQWRLENCTLYVTLEPCPMCSGAIILSRLKEVVYGSSDKKAGTCGTLMNLVSDERFNHQATVVSGVLEQQCTQLLQRFFQQLRQRNKQFHVKTQQGKQMDKIIQMILVKLQKQSNDSRLKHYNKIKMKEPYFGVMMGDLNKLAKQYAKQTNLGIGLWHSDYLEAKLLATKIIVPDELENNDVKWMSDVVFRESIADEWVDKIVSRRNDSVLWENEWFLSSELIKQRMAWGLLLKRVNAKKVDDKDIENVLNQIEQNLLSSDEIVQWKANQVLVHIGVYYDNYRKRCIEIGEKLRLYANDVVPKGCTRAYAPEWIEVLVKKNVANQVD